MSNLTKSRLKAALLDAANIALIVVTWLAAQSVNPLSSIIPDHVWAYVTLLASAFLSIYNGWKNHNYTQIAVATQTLLDGFKSISKTSAATIAAKVATETPVTTGDAVGSAATEAKTDTSQVEDVQGLAAMTDKDVAAAFADTTADASSSTTGADSTVADPTTASTLGA